MSLKSAPHLANVMDKWSCGGLSHVDYSCVYRKGYISCTSLVFIGMDITV